MSQEPTFQNLNFDTKPTSCKVEVIKVNINPDVILSDYANAYISELYRRNPIRAKEVNLSVEELHAYFTGLLTIRIESITGHCPGWRQAKQLLIPSWIEFILTRVGEVIDVDRGLKFIPSINSKYNMDAMLSTSAKLRTFINDGVILHQDAMPRGPKGDLDTMSMAIIEDYVCGQSKDSHPITSYIAAFLGFKIEQEAQFKLLYRVRYDDVEFIRSMLLSERSIL